MQYIHMKFGIILYSNDPETVFQAFRLGIYSLNKGDEVNMFLLAKGVECEDLDNDHFLITPEIRNYLDLGGKTYSCTSCMRIRQKESTEACPLSKMEDIYKIIAESDRVISL